MPIALYIHVPFCAKKCRYCGFTSYPFKAGDAENYMDALFREMSMYASALPDEEKEVSSLYIGGGTPTCLPAAGLSGMLDKAALLFNLLPDCEITVEANPGTIDLNGLRELRDAGVNRLSLGVQSFQDRLLSMLGRIHSAREAVNAVRQARDAGFSNLNLDFIFGIPGQTLDDWQETLGKAVELSPEHISVYGLQMEEGTPLERAVTQGEIKACPEELELSMYMMAVEFLASNGFIHYEISNFARPGRQSVHNLGYWLNLPYLGLGPAAHSYLRGERFYNLPSLKSYLEKISEWKYPVEAGENITVEREMSETMFLGLRLIDGVDLDRFHRRFGRRAEEIYQEEIARLEKAGLVKVEGGCLRLTKKGLPVANVAFMEFV